MVDHLLQATARTNFIHDPNNSSNWVALWIYAVAPNNLFMISSGGTYSSNTYSYYINGVQNSTTDISNGRWNHIAFNAQVKRYQETLIGVIFILVMIVILPIIWMLILMKLNFLAMS